MAGAACALKEPKLTNKPIVVATSSCFKRISFDLKNKISASVSKKKKKTTQDQ